MTFDIDANGICHVAAKDKATGKTQNITITANGGLSKADIERMIRDSESHAEADRIKRELVEVKNNAETQAHTAEKQLSDWKYVSDAEKAKAKEAAREKAKHTREANLAKYDTNKDGKLDDAEKAVKKADEEAARAAKKTAAKTAKETEAK